jgi:DNA polymerase-3 subunit beta
MPDRDFPKVPNHREVVFGEIDSNAFREMIDRTLFSVCHDETRFHLNGVLFECDGVNARMVSTDGHRLSKVDRRLPGAPQLSSGVIIPKKGVLELKKLLDGSKTAKISIKTPYLFLTADELTLTIKLIDAQFPPYDQVIPKNHTRSAIVDTGLFSAAVKRAQLMSSETRGIKLGFGGSNGGGITITSDNPDLGEIREEIDADYTGEPMTIGFNPKYILDILGQIQSDQVAVELGGDLEPGLIRPLTGDAFAGVIMPMRI